MRTIAGLLDRLRIVIVLSVSALAIASVAFAGPSSAHAATAPNVWWPSQNASLEGTQPFKAVIDGKSLSEYDMYWSVDNGGLVQMYDSQADYPHKEAQVDLSGWNWSSTGTYSVSFVAKDHSGSEIGRASVSIRHGSAQPAAVQPVAAAPAPAAATNPLTNPTAPTATVETARLDIRVWWPTENSTVSGVQPLKAVVGSNLTAYRLYWSIDGGGQTELKDSYVDAPHKEIPIDFTNWTWKGSSAYVLTLTAKDLKGNVIATKSLPVYVGTAAKAVTAPAPAPAPVTALAQPAATLSTSAAPAPTTALASGSKLYVDPANPAAAQAKAWASSQPANSAVMAKLGAQSSAIWLGGWNADVQSDVSKTVTAAKSQGTVPTFVAYNIPGRDCGQYSAGGLSGKDAYLAWVKKISAGIGSGQAIVILEPDALTLMDCLSDSQKLDRYSMISSAIDVLAANPGTKVYVDAGHPQWLSASEAAARLNKAGVSKAAGFALNTSNFIATSENVSYGTEVSRQTGGKHFVVDTSRNGNGQGDTWCNPSGRALGQQPTLSTGNPLVDAFLWNKRPGESDGTCNGGPSAGQWWPEYALGLALRAGY